MKDESSGSNGLNGLNAADQPKIPGGSPGPDAASAQRATSKATSRKVSFGATVKAVFWSFFGVRKKSDYEKDAAQLNPVHVVIAGLIGALLFIGLLVTVVRIVVAK